MAYYSAALNLNDYLHTNGLVGSGFDFQRVEDLLQFFKSLALGFGHNFILSHEFVESFSPQEKLWIVTNIIKIKRELGDFVP
jgi:hypothetical protein